MSHDRGGGGPEVVRGSAREPIIRDLARRGSGVGSAPRRAAMEGWCVRGWPIIGAGEGSACSPGEEEEFVWETRRWWRRSLTDWVKGGGGARIDKEEERVAGAVEGGLV